MDNIEYIIVLQCDIVKERCSGFFCEDAFHQRRGGFSDYPADKPIRLLTMTCGGCCGQAVQRKLSDLVKQIKKREDVDKNRIVVQLASCVTKDNYHGPPCPHLGYLKQLISRLGLDVYEDTHVSDVSQRRRDEGVYGG